MLQIFNVKKHHSGSYLTLGARDGLLASKKLFTRRIIEEKGTFYSTSDYTNSP